MSEEELELHSINIKDRKYYSQYIVNQLQQENKELKDNIEYWQQVCDKKQDKIFELLAKLEMISNI